MKTHRFEIAKFLKSESDEDGNIYIDWPSVHRQAGVDQIQWIESQDPAECQLLLEIRPEDTHVSAVVEIYSDKIATLYTLMWAK